MAFNDPEIARIAAPKRRRLEALEPKYRRAKNWLETYAGVDNLELVKEVAVTVGMYNLGDPPQSAVFLLGQLQQLLYHAGENRRVVEEYETLEKQMRALEAEDLARTGATTTPEEA